MTLPSVRERGARQLRALGATLGVMLSGAAAVSVDETQVPYRVRPPAAAASGNVQTADNMIQSRPAPVVLPLQPTRRTRPDGEPSNQRVLMLMLLGGAAGSAGPFGRLGQ